MSHPNNAMNVPTFDAKYFTWLKDQGLGVSDISDLTPHGIHDITGCLFKDAADVGLALKSPRTGVVKRFFLASTNKDREGDVRAWVFLEINDRGHIPSGALQLVINND